MKSNSATPIFLLFLNGSIVHVESAFHAQKHFHNSILDKHNNDNVFRLCMSHEDNERARVEKDLEDMMGNDWRLFRAQLVAQEQLEENEHNEEQYHTLHETKKSQNQFSNLLKNAVSLFSSAKLDDTERNAADDDLVFDIEGVTCEDPFATPDEILAVRKPKKTINKQQWAHPISHIEPGCCLLATERLRGVFRQAIVLIIDHSEAMGSTGIIINRPLPGKLQKIASETPSNIDTSLKLAFGGTKVSYGGPVMQQDYSILHGFGEVEGSKKVAPGVFVGGSRELMNEVRMNYFSPKDALFVKGHAAWIPNQLSRELKKGVWYTASVSSDFMLRHARGGENYDGDLWYEIMNSMGGKYAEIADRHSDSQRMMP